jgi:NTP pyrophosphatase (non-canonical NTP hydrolase)
MSEKDKTLLEQFGLGNSADIYQLLAGRTALWHEENGGNGLVGGLPPLLYCALKLTGEAGEVSEKLGKYLRDTRGRLETMEPEYREAMALELGDVLWYLAMMAADLGFDLTEVMRLNLQKLASRRERGTLHGAGDER